MADIIFTLTDKTLTYPPPAKNSYISHPIPRQFSEPTADGNSRSVTYGETSQFFEFTLADLEDADFDELMEFLKDDINFAEKTFTFTDPKETEWAKVKYEKGIETASVQANGYKSITLTLQQQH